MNTNINILFWIKKSRIVNGKAPIAARVTIDRKRFDFVLKREVNVLKWDSKGQRVNSKGEESKEINNYLAQVKNELVQCNRRMTNREEKFTVEDFKKEFTGHEIKARMFLEIIRQHNDEIFELIGKGYSVATWKKYKTILKHVTAFLKWKYKMTDIDIKKLNFGFINDFEFYLRSQKNIATNSVGKYIRNLKKITRLCLEKDWLAKDPFIAYRIKIKTVERYFLNEIELATLHEKHFGIDRLDQVKDIFLFSCYTGLAYIDVFNLSVNNISIGIDGQKWIFTHRQKTASGSHIPLLPPALKILEKYQNHKAIITSGKVLPIPSNKTVLFITLLFILH